jgi:hypothetical protein
LPWWVDGGIVFSTSSFFRHDAKPVFVWRIFQNENGSLIAGSCGAESHWRFVGQIMVVRTESVEDYHD